MLRIRITLVAVVAAIAAIVVTVVTTYHSVAPLVVGQFERGLSDRTDTLLAVLPAGAPLPVRPDTTEQLLLPDGTVQVLTPGRNPLPVTEADREVARTGRGTVTVSVELDGAPHDVVTKARPGGGAVMVGRNYAEVERVDREFLDQTVWVTAAALAAAAVLCWLAIGGILRPIRRLAAATERIATTQDLSTNLVGTARGEVGELTRNFNTMLAALRFSRAQQQRLAEDAGHELRTPLTSVRASAELLQRAGGRLAPDDEAKVLGTLLHEALALDELVRELVDLATDQYAAENPVPLDLVELAENCAARLRRCTGRSVTVEAVDPATVRVRPRALARCLDNLLDNAAKYSPPETDIYIEIRKSTMAVRDHGPGIDTADRDAVFDRFYRAKRTRASPGSGLGLAIVHDVVTAHGGSVHVDNHTDGGASVGFTLPGVDRTPENVRQTREHPCDKRLTAPSFSARRE